MVDVSDIVVVSTRGGRIKTADLLIRLRYDARWVVAVPQRAYAETLKRYGNHHVIGCDARTWGALANRGLSTCRGDRAWVAPDDISCISRLESGKYVAIRDGEELRVALDSVAERAHSIGLQAAHLACGRAARTRLLGGEGMATVPVENPVPYADSNWACDARSLECERLGMTVMSCPNIRQVRDGLDRDEGSGAWLVAPACVSGGSVDDRRIRPMVLTGGDEGCR